MYKLSIRLLTGDHTNDPGELIMVHVGKINPIKAEELLDGSGIENDSV